KKEPTPSTPGAQPRPCSPISREEADAYLEALLGLRGAQEALQDRTRSLKERAKSDRVTRKVSINSDDWTPTVESLAGSLDKLNAKFDEALGNAINACADVKASASSISQTILIIDAYLCCISTAIWALNDAPVWVGGGVQVYNEII